MAEAPQINQQRLDNAARRRVAVVEDHLLQRQRTEELLVRGGYEVVFSGEEMDDLLTWMGGVENDRRPELLVLDLMVERRPSVDPATVRDLISSGIRILVLSALAAPALVRDVIRAGVGGVVGKRDTEADILEAVAAVLDSGEWMTPDLAGVIAADDGRPRLSGQEERVLVLYASGLTLDAVAASLHIKRDTAKQYLDRVRAKYAAAGRPARTKVELARVAWTDGYIDPTA